MRAIGYFTEPPSPAGGGPSPSLSSQNDHFLNYCEANGYAPAAAFLDPDLSGDRPGFQQLCQYLDRPQKGFCAVVVEAFRHLGQSPADAARAYYQLTALAAKVVSLQEGPLDDARLIDLWRDTKAEPELGDKVRDAMRKRAVQGKVLGRPPYGYTVGPDRRLEIVEHEAEVVRYIFRLYLAGFGIRRIAKQLNEEGYRTRRGGRWSMVTIRDLLRNRVYLGTYHRFGVKVPGSHPALVKEADFRAVQEAMDARRTPRDGRKNAPSRFLLSGLVYCADTDSMMIGVTRRQSWTRRDGEVGHNTYRYYQSEARTNQSVGGYHTQRADDLEAEVRGHLTGETPGAVRPAVLSAGDGRAVAAETALAESRVRARLRTLERRLQDQLDRAAAGRLPRDDLARRAQSLVAEYRQAQDELAALQRRSAAQTSERERRRFQEAQLRRIRDDWDDLSFSERQELLRDVVERVVVGPDGVRTILRA